MLQVNFLPYFSVLHFCYTLSLARKARAKNGRTFSINADVQMQYSRNTRGRWKSVIYYQLSLWMLHDRLHIVSMAMGPSMFGIWF